MQQCRFAGFLASVAGTAAQELKEDNPEVVRLLRSAAERENDHAT